MIHRPLRLAALLATILAVFTCGGCASTPHEIHTPDPRPVVFLGTGGITWADLSPQATPTLWHFLADGSSSTLMVRSVNPNTCPVDGWLTLSAGQRAASPIEEPPGAPDTFSAVRSSRAACPSIPASPADPWEPDPSAGTAWQVYQRGASELLFGAKLGTLAQHIAAAGGCVAAAGPGARLGAALPDGTLALDVPATGAGVASALDQCSTVLVDLGSLRDPDDLPSSELVDHLGSRSEQVSAIDARAAEVLAALPEGTDVLLGSISDAGRQAHLRLAAAIGPDYPVGLLWSSSTRQRGLAQNQDLTVTLIFLAGGEIPGELGGATLGTLRDNGPVADRQRLLLDAGEAASSARAIVPVFFATVAYAQIVIYLFVLWVWRGRLGTPRSRLRALRLARVVGIGAASIPVATFLANLVPWWRAGSPMGAVVGAVSLAVLTITTLALVGPWRRSVIGAAAVVGSVTVAVLGVDVLTGSRLQLSSLMGYSTLVGGRFYGLGNVAFSLFSTASIFLAVAVAQVALRRAGRWAAAAAAAAVGLVVTVIDGSPTWGADGGGPMALIPAYTYLVLALLGIRITWRRAAAILLATAAAFLSVAYLDWRRPEAARSHLGRFFQAILDGGAGEIIRRKAEANLGILLGGNIPLTVLVPVALAFVIYVLARETSWGSRALQRSYDRVPTLKPGMIALLVLYVLGFALNDSGVAIPAVGVMIAVPLLIAISVRSLEDDYRRSA